MGAMEIVHRVDRQQNHQILFQFRFISRNAQLHDAATFNHFSQNLIDIVSIFAGPLSNGATEIGAIFL